MYKENNNLEEQIIQQTESGTDTINSLGLCLGASTVSIVHMERKRDIDQKIRKDSEIKPRIVKFSLHTHEGDPKQTLLAALKNFDLKSFYRGRQLPWISEYLYSLHEYSLTCRRQNICLIHDMDFLKQPTGPPLLSIHSFCEAVEGEIHRFLMHTYCLSPHLIFVPVCLKHIP